MERIQDTDDTARNSQKHVADGRRPSIIDDVNVSVHRLGVDKLVDEGVICFYIALRRVSVFQVNLSTTQH